MHRLELHKKSSSGDRLVSTRWEESNNNENPFVASSEPEHQPFSVKEECNLDEEIFEQEGLANTAK